MGNLNESEEAIRNAECAVTERGELNGEVGEGGLPADDDNHQGVNCCLSTSAETYSTVTHSSCLSS